MKDHYTIDKRVRGEAKKLEGKKTTVGKLKKSENPL
jgi:hypothetical protein